MSIGQIIFPSAQSLSVPGGGESACCRAEGFGKAQIDLGRRFAFLICATPTSFLMSVASVVTAVFCGLHGYTDSVLIGIMGSGQ
jgi:hypothetical protein